ncbi:MAG TPA: multicopper oxidase domain-containing protein [Polyangiaceae bacterium]|jgi:spore coat protein A|nr:multicopper oxidase domain-containing protein [Polyangiaceae bacterium]
MSITRRRLLTEGTWLATFASVAAAGRFSFELGGCDSVPHSGADAAPPASSSGGVCTSTVAAAPPFPVRPLLRPETLARFVDPLPVPPVLSPEGMRPDPEDPSRHLPYYRVTMREAAVRVHRDLPPARAWTYGGLMPGPTFEVRSGHGILVEWVNDLPERHFLPVDRTIHGAHDDRPEVRAVVHLHGAKVAAESDGYPDDWYPPGHSKISHFPARQDATMLWYHDHAMGIERLNQYAGLFGVFFIRDDEEDALHLPAGQYEIPLVLCDRLFDDKGQLSYPISGVPGAPWVSEVQGHVVIANGTIFPFVDVEPRLYRLRVVNASNSRTLMLSRSDAVPLVAIGADQGLLPAPASVPALELAPAERADLLVDFRSAAGKDVVLKTDLVEVLQFRVAAAPVPAPVAIPRSLRRAAFLDTASARKTRNLVIVEREQREYQGRMQMLFDGRRWSDPVTEQPLLDSVEIWSFFNTTDDSHPIHLHAVRFQILDRQIFEADLFRMGRGILLRGKPVPPDPAEAGWKDTVRAHPGAITRIIARFDGYAGRYVWHCHNLEHAANEMMRPFEIVRQA